MDYTDARTLQMVRDLNVFLANASDDEVKPYVQFHAFPRVRFKMLTATDTLGRHVFYGRITDLTNPDLQKAAEILLDQVLANDIVMEGVRAIIAKFACAAMTTHLAAQLEDQRDYAKMLEKQANSALDEFVRSPILGGVVSAIKATVTKNLQATSFGLACELNPMTFDKPRLTATPFTTAQEAGELRLYIDGMPLTIAVAAGDTPAQVLRKLSLKAVQTAGLRQIELIALDQVNALRTYARRITVDDVIYSVQTSAVVAESKLQSRTSAGVHASLASLSLVHTENGSLRPGLAGFVIGYGTDYPSFKTDLNPVILGDIKNCDFILPTDPDVCFHPAEFLCFKATTADGTLAGTVNGAANTLKYKISEVIVGGISNRPTRSSAEVTITVQTGWTALNVVEAIAQDLGKRRAQQQVLGAVIPSLAIDISGAKEYVPALDLVGFSTDQDLEVKYMFQLTKLPTGLETTLATRAGNATAFDVTPDSVVLTAITLGRSEVVSLDSQGMGGASAKEGIASTQMADALAKVKRMIDTGR